MEEGSDVEVAGEDVDAVDWVDGVDEAAPSGPGEDVVADVGGGRGRFFSR